MFYNETHRGNTTEDPVGLIFVPNMTFYKDSLCLFSVCFFRFLDGSSNLPLSDILLICQGPMAKATALESPKPVSPRTDDKDHFHG